MVDVANDSSTSTLFKKFAIS